MRGVDETNSKKSIAVTETMLAACRCVVALIAVALIRIYIFITFIALEMSRPLRSHVILAPYFRKSEAARQLTLALFRDNPIVLAVLELGELAQIQASFGASS